jgi:protein-S-isoprenylcysteine O-methyltransferase Ste14
MQDQSISRRRLVIIMVVLPVLCALFMFWPAGTFAWFKGWLFLVVMVSLETVAVIYLWRKNPEVIAARSRLHKGTKRWDKIILACLAPSMLAIFPIAALDDSRFHWSQMQPWSVALGYVLLTGGLAASTAALAVNKFAEPTVRIQADRGHAVVDSGPYALVRHPLYVGAVLMFTGVALALGSWWALFPVGMVVVILLVRTALEDRTLRNELPGYQAYAQRVRYKLIPGIW